MSMQEKLLEEIERLQKGGRVILETKLKERHAVLYDLYSANERISIGSPSFDKGPLYWNFIIVKEYFNFQNFLISDPPALSNCLIVNYKRQGFFRERAMFFYYKHMFSCTIIF